MSIIFFIIFSFFSLRANAIGESVEVLNAPATGMLNLPIFFISDNQFHNFMTDPTALRNKLADKFVRVAIRPPLQDLFAKDLFIYAMEKYSRGNYVIHLGDSLNISCKNEWNNFEEAMNMGMPGNRLNKGWVMAPGNHDSFFFGNTLGVIHSENTPVLKAWIDSCSNIYPPPKVGNPKDAIFTKDVFVKNYYRNLLNQGRENPIDFPQVRDVNCVFNPQKVKNIWYEEGSAMAVCDWKNKDANGFLQKFRLTYPQKDDVKVSYRAYILQELNLTKFYNLDYKMKAILLDTSDYKNVPSLFTGAIRSFTHLPGSRLNAGINGGLGVDQVETIKRWIRENGPNTFYVFMGHHNLESFDDDSIRDLREILKVAQNGIYISSHTHEGFIKKHKNITEINLGSITDHPNQAMALSFKGYGKNISTIGFWPNIIHFSADTLMKEGFCSPEDFADKDPNPYFHYLSYKKLPGFGTSNQVHELTIDNNLMGLYKAFKKLGLYKNTQDPILNKLEEVLIKSPKKCGPPIGKENTICRKEKVDLENQLHKIDNGLYSSPLRDQRIIYGACQALWAAYAERGRSNK